VPTRSGSWSLPVVDGAYSEVVAWTSARSWIAIARRVLQSPRGEKQRLRLKIAIDTVLRVAAYDAETADKLTGRGVSTSHMTVARALGMSSRHVGTARRLLEKLGLAITIVRGRHLSPAERSLARRTHGAYQQTAASVRALTVPLPARLVENFHLPRSGSVSEERNDQRWSPTRAAARKTAASRPNRRRTGHADDPARRSARPLESQRFAWTIARRYGLLSSGPLRRFGLLTGGRHIGQLWRILDRYEITPDRYSLKTLQTELDLVMTDAKIRPVNGDDKRDRLAYFAWQMSKLHAASTGETLLQRQRREAAVRLQKRQERFQHMSTQTVQENASTTASEAAAAEFFNSWRRTRGHSPAGSSSGRSTRDLVQAVLAPGQQLYNLSAQSQILVGELTTLDKILRTAGWTVTTETETRTIRWTNAEQLLVARCTGDTELTITIDPPAAGSLPEEALQFAFLQ